MIHWPSGLACDEVWREEHLESLYKEPIGDWREKLNAEYRRWQAACERGQYPLPSAGSIAPMGTVQKVSLPVVRTPGYAPVEGAHSEGVFSEWGPPSRKGRDR